MRASLRAATLIVAAATTPLPASAAGAGLQGNDAAATAAGKKVRVIVRLKADSAASGAAAESTLRGRMAGAGVGAVERLGGLPLARLEVDAAQRAALEASGLVDEVVEDRLLRPDATPNLELIDAPPAWRSGRDGTGLAVAILDTGVASAHPFLKGKVVAEACYSSTVASQGATSLCPKGAASSTAKGSGEPCAASIDGCEHGTHVAGIAAGRTTATRSGVAPGARLISVQVYSRFGDAETCGGAAPCVLAYTSDIIQGLERVRALSATYRIAAANLSLGGGTSAAACDDDPTKAAMDALKAKGIATVVAAGNAYAHRAVSYPGCVSTAITVAASTTTAPPAIPGFSNMGKLVDLVAPGVGIISSVPGGGYAKLSGTSMAAPHVAGAWAVLKSQKVGATVAAVEAALEATGHPVTDSRTGIAKPEIDVAAALARLKAGAAIAEAGP